jgi:hypothetical protein
MVAMYGVEDERGKPLRTSGAYTERIDWTRFRPLPRVVSGGGGRQHDRPSSSYQNFQNTTDPDPLKPSNALRDASCRAILQHAPLHVRKTRRLGSNLSLNAFFGLAPTRIP